MGDTPELIKITRFDSQPVNEAHFTEEGYLVDKPIVTSAGIFEYNNPDGSKRRELRLPEYVFAEESLKSYKGKPVIITHNAMYIDKSNVDDEIIGTILSEGQKDGDNVRAEIIIHNTEAMKKSGLRELSLGYDLELDETPGEWNGKPYDAVQKNIVINHLALVRSARAGEQARLNIDGGEETTNNENPKGEKEEMAETAVINDENGVSEETAASTENSGGQTMEEKLNFIRDRKDRRDRGDSDKSEISEDIDALLSIVEELQAKNDLNEIKNEDSTENEDSDENEEPDASKPSMNADSIDEIVRERLYLGRLGDKLNLDVYDMKPHEAKKAIIKNRFPNVRLDAKSDGYVNAMFKDVASEVNARKDVNYQRKQMTQNRADSADFRKSSSELAREKMINRNLNGGKQ